MKQALSIPDAPRPFAPYSQAISAGGFLFVSGQIPANPFTGKLVLTNIAAQTTQVMTNLSALLQEAGCSWANVVKVTIFLTDMQDYDTVNQVYGTYFEGIVPPARECVQVVALPRGVNVEISLIAILPFPEM